jgi:hypothetical protein
MVGSASTGVEEGLIGVASMLFKEYAGDRFWDKWSERWQSASPLL